MADSVYDPETEGKQTTGASGLSPDISSNSTSPSSSSFTRSDALDPVRRAEGSGFWKPHSNRTGSPGEGASDSTAGSEGGATSKTGGQSAVSPGDVRNSEESAGEDDSPARAGYSKGKSSSTSPTRSKYRTNRRRAIIGVGALTGVAGSGVLVFFLLIPLKIEHIIKNLENHFGATAQNALDNETQTIFEKYVVKRVLPGYSRCGTTLRKDCSALRFSGNGNPINNLYNAWSQARLENTLAEKYNIEFQRRADGWYLKSPGLTGKGAFIGQSGEKLDNVFQKTDISGMRQAIKDETQWYQVFTRYKVGRLLEEKYGIKRCIIYCGVTDPLHNKIAEQKIAAKLYLTQRVIIPRNMSLGIALECLFTGCDPTTNNQPAADPNAPAAEGEPASPVETQVSEGMRTLAQSYGIVDEATLTALQDTFNKISDEGIQKYLITEGLTSLGANDATAAITADAIPIAGEINLAANIIDSANNAGGTIKKLRYVVNSTADIQLAEMYTTYADEIHTGHVTATEVGSMVDSLGAATNTKNIVGGTASAESTPLYQHVIEGKSSSSVSTSLSTTKYKCNNGKAVSSGSLVCSEESLGGGNSVANTIHDFLNTGPLAALTTLAEAWKSTIGSFFQIASSLVGDILGPVFGALQSAADLSCNLPFGLGIPPGYCQIRGLAKSASSAIITGVTQWLIPDPFSANMSGGRTFDLVAAGKDAEWSTVGQRTIGGKVLNTTQTAAILNQQQNEAQQQFSHESFFARMFSTDDTSSLVSKIAMDVPLNIQASATTSFASLLSNPFGALAHSFGSIFSKPVSASAPEPDPFGVPQYGYTSVDLASIGDPETYWDNNCVDDPSQGYQKDNAWNVAAASTTDPNTGMPENTTTNPCIMIKTIAGSAGGKYDTSLLTADDTADINNSQSGDSSPLTGGTTAAPGTVVFPFPKGLAVSPAAWTQDQGVDISTNGSACGKNAPERAMGNGVIVGRGISGFGPDAPILHITDTAGPLADRYIYYGHAGDNQNSNNAGRPSNTNIGDHVTAGEVITYTGCGDVPSPQFSSGPHLEIGIWPKGATPSTSFPSLHQTSAEMLQILTDSYNAQGG